MSLPIMNTIMNTTLDEVEQELDGAKRKFPPINSGHEAYAVIAEELQEFWDEVRLKTGMRSGMRKELIQIAAMAVRAIEDLSL